MKKELACSTSRARGKKGQGTAEWIKEGKTKKVTSDRDRLTSPQ